MKKVLLVILAIFILIQFIRPEKNLSRDYSNDISNEYTVPSEVQEIIKNSCADCHTNFTKYPWYSNVAPVSWYLGQHVWMGKEHLNFSEWTNYNKNQKEHILKDLEEVLQTKEMPLASYLNMHEEAKLTAEEYQLFYNWVKSLDVK